MEEDLIEEALTKLRIYLKEFRWDLKDAKIVDRKYLRYKKDKNSARLPVINFDEKRENSIKIIKEILNNLFEEVVFIPVDMPCIVVKDTNLYLLEKFKFKDNLIVAKKMRENFESLYGINRENYKIVMMYLGGGYLFPYYKCDDQKQGKKLTNDILFLYEQALEVKKEIPQLISDYFEIPTKLEKVEEVKPATKFELAQKPKTEIEKIFEELMQAEVEEKPVKPSVDEKEIQDTIKNFNPPVNDFYAMAAKIQYEVFCNKVKREKEGEIKKKVDHLFYQFIKSSKPKKELYLEFNENLKVYEMALEESQRADKEERFKKL
jgi:hypothetical protein